ncbi:MAG: septum site-determining protein MinC [Andreesenia angusta]|nr:septum site-determining protein MinC [Andreesenia angusta]
MKSKLIQIKGDNEAINIYIKKSEASQVLRELENKLESSKAFFEGAVVNKIIGESLSYRDMKNIEELLWSKFNISIKDNNIFNDIDNEVFEPAEEEEIESNTIEENEQISYEEEIEDIDTYQERNLILKTTVRSGQVIRQEGNIVIIGDVNPGGVVEATGNIIVFGSVRGVLKAGILGDKEAYVLAIKLKPNQIAIADIITRKPDDYDYNSNAPEIARIVDENIVIEEFMRK